MSVLCQPLCFARAPCSSLQELMQKMTVFGNCHLRIIGSKAAFRQAHCHQLAVATMQLMGLAGSLKCGLLLLTPGWPHPMTVISFYFHAQCFVTFGCAFNPAIRSPRSLHACCETCVVGMPSLWLPELPPCRRCGPGCQGPESADLATGHAPSIWICCCRALLLLCHFYVRLMS